MKKQYQIDLSVLSSMKIALLFCIGLSFSTYSQREKPKNYRKFDDKLLHFGFMLGGNTADFTAYQKLNAYELFGLKSLENKSSAGGQVGIVTTMKIGTPVVRLRFIPTLSFQERILRYTFVNPDTTAIVDIFNERRVNSTNLDFPLMWQFRTVRYNNFASYVLLGGQYSVDLQSQQDANQDYINPFIKIKKHDFQAQLGIGVEFFAPYFKFGMEVKYSHGLVNSFIQDNTPVSDPVQKLYNKVWWFSIIFEG